MCCDFTHRYTGSKRALYRGFFPTCRAQQLRHHVRLFGRSCGRLIQAGFLMHDAEKALRAVGSLRWPEQKVSAGIQCVIERVQHLLLHLMIQVNKYIATGYQIDPREWRVLQETVVGKQHHVAQILPHAVVIWFAYEEPTQSFLAHVGFDGGRVSSLRSEER